MNTLWDDFEIVERRPLPPILAFYEQAKRNGLCLHTIGWTGEGKNEKRIYCFQPVTQVWFIYCHSEAVWYATSATCEKHCGPGEHNHPISAPYPYRADWTDEKLRRGLCVQLDAHQLGLWQKVG